METPAVITDVAELTPGWYCVGFADESGNIDWGGTPIYHYLGESCWEDDAGESVESFWDTFLQVNVATNAADGYLRQ